MRKANKILIMVLALVFALSMQAAAFEVNYLGLSPNYAVTSVSGNDVKEDYNAQSLIPFTSHDGNAVVDLYLNSTLDLNGTFWFDKELVFDEKDLKKNFEITWKITNGATVDNKVVPGKYTWSDYHFILEDKGQIIEKAQSADFKGVTIIGNTEIDFYYDPPGGKLVAPGDTLQVNFALDLSGIVIPDTLIDDGFQLKIGVRQIATASPAPIPGSLLLLGTGILGLIGLRRRL